MSSEYTASIYSTYAINIGTRYIVSTRQTCLSQLSCLHEQSKIDRIVTKHRCASVAVLISPHLHSTGRNTDVGRVYRCGGIMQLLHMTIDEYRQLEEIRHALSAARFTRLSLQAPAAAQRSHLEKHFYPIQHLSIWIKIFIQQHLLRLLREKKT